LAAIDRLDLAFLGKTAQQRVVLRQNCYRIGSLSDASAGFFAFPAAQTISSLVHFGVNKAGRSWADYSFVTA